MVRFAFGTQAVYGKHLQRPLAVPLRIRTICLRPFFRESHSPISREANRCAAAFHGSPVAVSRQAFDGGYLAENLYSTASVLSMRPKDLIGRARAFITSAGVVSGVDYVCSALSDDEIPRALLRAEIK